MNRSISKIGIAVVVTSVALAFAPLIVSGHQPRITESRVTNVSEPEISKAYYGRLTGAPDVYIIQATVPFDLYVNVLVPDIVGQKRDVSAEVLRDGARIAFLDGNNFEWKQFYEPFGADSYWMGPEYKAQVDAGRYEIRVSNAGNDSKYALAIGEIEAFNGAEGLRAMQVIPELKKNFFNESPIGFIRSPFGWGLIVAMYILAGVVFFLYRAVATRSGRGSRRNIGASDRLLRLAIGAALLLVAMATTWNPILLFISGLAVFEALFSWCAVYHAIGKSTP